MTAFLVLARTVTKVSNPQGGGLIYVAAFEMENNASAAVQSKLADGSGKEARPVPEAGH